MSEKTSKKEAKSSKPVSKKKITFTKARARKVLRGPLFWIILALILVSFFGRISSSGDKFTKVETSTILAAISANKVDSALVVDREQKIEVILKSGNFVKGSKKIYASYVSGEEPQIIELLTSNPPPKKWDVKVPSQSVFVSILLSILPLLLIGFLLLLFMGNAQGGNRVFSFGKSKAKLQTKEMPKNTFADVAGADEAVAELTEIKDFLASPQKYQDIGAKIPKGVLLYGHDEREQTLNQLLVEMDGFEANGQVILIAATNRPDVLDPALLRPGRFDRQIPVDRPDLKGRTAILEVHAKNKPVAKSVKLEDFAKRTPGFTGADLANVLNEAALLTARENAKVITNAALDEAIDRVMAGPQRKTRLMTEEERRITAYHEGGHALVAHALPHTDPVHKITIMPRGRALGYTMILPDEDRYATTRNQMLDQLAYSLGGRAAEELIFHDPTTGASNDIEKATNLARAMVTQYGMTERIGAIKLGVSEGEPFLGRSYGHQRDYSEEIAGIVDGEIRNLIENAHQEAYEILVANRDILDDLVEVLLEKETLLKDEIEMIFKKVRLVSRRPAWTGSETRKPSTQPPVALSPAKPQAPVVEEEAQAVRKPRKKATPPSE